MLSMLALIPATFALLVWRSFRSEAARRARGEAVSTPGTLRWTSSDVTS